MPHEEPHDPLAPPDPLRDWYVNTIWGKRVSDDDILFEVMSLQVFQAGLTWRMILNKRDGFRSAFGGWNIETVAGYGPAEVEALRNDSGIIRNRLKIQATVDNARAIVDEVISIAHERESDEEIIKAQLEIERCSPGKYYPFNDRTWQLVEEKTGRKRQN